MLLPHRMMKLTVLRDRAPPSAVVSEDSEGHCPPSPRRVCVRGPRQRGHKTADMYAHMWRQTQTSSPSPFHGRKPTGCMPEPIHSQLMPSNRPLTKPNEPKHHTYNAPRRPPGKQYFRVSWAAPHETTPPPFPYRPPSVAA